MKSPELLQSILDASGLTVVEFARHVLGCTERRVKLWLGGTYAIPLTQLAWLQRVRIAVEKHEVVIRVPRTWETSENDSRQAKPPRPRTAVQAPGFWDELRGLVYVDGLSDRAIAKRYGVSAAIVWRWRHDAEIVSPRATETRAPNNERTQRRTQMIHALKSEAARLGRTDLTLEEMSVAVFGERRTSPASLLISRWGRESGGDGPYKTTLAAIRAASGLTLTHGKRTRR